MHMHTHAHKYRHLYVHMCIHRYIHTNTIKGIQIKKNRMNKTMTLMGIEPGTFGLGGGLILITRFSRTENVLVLYDWL